MVDDSVAMTPFYLLLGKHRQQQESREVGSSAPAERTPLPQGSVAIKEVSICVVCKQQNVPTLHLTFTSIILSVSAYPMVSPSCVMIPPCHLLHTRGLSEVQP